MATKPRRTRRPNEPTPPRVISVEEIAAAAPHDLETAIAAHEAWADRLFAADDPGRGLPPVQAAAARKQQLRQLQTHTEAVGPLRVAYDATSPEHQREQALWQRIQNKARRKAAAEATSPEDQAQIDAAHEALRVAERARKAREKMAALRERLHNPPSPDAPELIGAIMMQPELLEALEHKLREDQDGTWTATHMLTAEELGVLCVCLHLLRELGSVEISGMATSARWPRREPPLVATTGLKDALLQLRRERLLSFTVEGDVARVSYGDRVREIAAAKWGLVLTPAS